MDMLYRLSYKGILRNVEKLSSDEVFVNYMGRLNPNRHENCLHR